jgi:hypothetical protein
MKRILFLITLVFISEISLLAQGSYELIISNPSHQYIRDCVEDQEGNIYIVGENIYVENNQVVLGCGTIYKIDPNGIIISEDEYCYPDSMLTFFEVDIVNDSLYLLGGSGAMEVSYPDLFDVYILNQDLNKIDHAKIRLFNDLYLGGMKHMIHPSSDIILLGYAYPGGTVPNGDVYFYRFTSNLDSVSCIRDEKESDQYGFDFFIDPDNGGYRVFGFGYYPNSPSSHSKIVYYDSLFTFVSADSLAWNLGGHNTCRWMSDSTYVVTGRKHFYPPARTDMALILLNREDHLLQTGSFGKGEDTVDYAGAKDNFDYVMKDNIFFGGTSNFVVSQWPWQTDDSWINLINLDSNLNVNWQRYYGGDAFYVVYGLIATQDGGCFIYSTRYDENINYLEYDIYIMKVDSNGLLTSVSEIPNIAADEMYVFPNPASDRITVQFPGVSHVKEKQLYIHNSLGITVWKCQIPEWKEQIVVDLDGLPSGFYFSSIISRGNQITAGKFLITR